MLVLYTCDGIAVDGRQYFLKDRWIELGSEKLPCLVYCSCKLFELGSCCMLDRNAFRMDPNQYLSQSLLCPRFIFAQVRSHAVSVLQQKDDDELMYYLLQLVQVSRTSVPLSFGKRQIMVFGTLNLGCWAALLVQRNTTFVELEYSQRHYLSFTCDVFQRLKWLYKLSDRQFTPAAASKLLGNHQSRAESFANACIVLFLSGIKSVGCLCVLPEFERVAGSMYKYSVPISIPTFVGVSKSLGKGQNNTSLFGFWA